MAMPEDEMTEQDIIMSFRKGVGVVSHPEVADGVVSERPRSGGPPVGPLTLSEVKAILSNEISSAIGNFDSTVSRDQQKAIDFYYGRSIGNEQPDRSKVVLMDVLEVVEWAMPSLMRMFTGGSKIVEFKAKRGEDQRKAELATEYINHVFINEMDGFQVLYDWFKSALLEKNGVVKVFFDERVTPEVERYSGLTEDEVVSVLDREGVTPISAEPRVALLTDPRTGDRQEVNVFDIELNHIKRDSRIRVEAVPPEEFLIAKRATKLDDETPFAAHRKLVTIGELVSRGYPMDVLASLPYGDSIDTNLGSVSRRDDDDEFLSNTSGRTDVASRELWAIECYAKIDEDGDGHAELRKFLVIGDDASYVVDDEQINQTPFCSITPIPMPHKFYGQSLADLVTDLQVIRSTILRQMLDHLYLANNPRMAITEGMVEVDDLLTVRPGGLVRQRGPGSIEPLVTQDLPRDTFPMLQYLEQVRSNRTGVMAHGQDMEAGMLSNTTAAAVASLEGAKQQKIELIARIFAATGMKNMFKKMLKLMATQDTKERQVKVAGEWAKLDPTDFDFDCDVEIEVGLGAGKSAEQVQALNMLMQIQGRMVESGGLNYLVTPQNLYEAGRRMAEAMGYPNGDLFFQNPEGVEPPQPEPSPEMERLKLDALKAETDSKAQSGDMQLKALKEKNIVKHRSEELALKEKIDMERIASQERIAMQSGFTQIDSALIANENEEKDGED